MVFSKEHHVNMRTAMASNLKSFIREHKLKNFQDFVSSMDEGVGVVVACFFDVVEGVDMWYPDEATALEPRFNVK
jgi:Sec7-like guanine-nucleotide exchange factor